MNGRITASLQTRHIKCTIIQVYAPTNSAGDPEMDTFFEQVQQILDNVPNHDIIGKEVEGIHADNSKPLLILCGTNPLKIGVSLFQYKRIHKLTWRSAKNAAVNQIDHVCLSQG